MLHPFSTDVNTSDLHPSMRQNKSLVGAASTQLQETAQAVLLLVSANLMIRGQRWRQQGRWNKDIIREAQEKRMNFELVNFSIFLFNVHKKSNYKTNKKHCENLKELPQELWPIGVCKLELWWHPVVLAKDCLVLLVSLVQCMPHMLHQIQICSFKAGSTPWRGAVSCRHRLLPWVGACLW